MDQQEVLKSPVLTEKATAMAEKSNQISFFVACAATKRDIRAAVQAGYGVTVTGVRTSVMPGKVKRRGKSVGRLPKRKKAVVCLAPGDKIDFYAAE